MERWLLPTWPAALQGPVTPLEHRHCRIIGGSQPRVGTRSSPRSATRPACRGGCLQFGPRISSGCRWAAVPVRCPVARPRWSPDSRRRCASEPRCRLSTRAGQPSGQQGPGRRGCQTAGGGGTLPSLSHRNGPAAQPGHLPPLPRAIRGLPAGRPSAGNHFRTQRTQPRTAWPVGNTFVHP